MIVREGRTIYCTLRLPKNYLCFSIFCSHIGSNSQNYYYYFYKYFSVPYVCNFVDLNVYSISACWYCFYIYESIALLIWALSIPLFQIHILHIWLIIIIFLRFFIVLFGC